MRRKAMGPVLGVSIMALAMLASAQAEDSSGSEGKRLSENDRRINAHAERQIEEGRKIFRFDTYGS